MDDPYNCEVRPTKEWVYDNCDYSVMEGYKYKHAKKYDFLLFRWNNKCKMLNGDWGDIREDIARDIMGTLEGIRK
jgi:hypothetical protein